MNCLTACFNFVASNKAVQDALQNAIQDQLLPKLDALPMGVHLRGLINVSINHKILLFPAILHQDEKLALHTQKFS